MYGRVLCVYLPVIKVVQSIWDNFMCYCPAIIDTVSHSWYLALTSKIHPGVASKAWPRFSLYHDGFFVKIRSRYLDKYDRTRIYSCISEQIIRCIACKIIPDVEIETWLQIFSQSCLLSPMSRIGPRAEEEITGVR